MIEMYKENDLLKLYPDKGGLFKDPDLSSYLKPILSIHLKSVIPDCEIWLPCVAPIEPSDLLLGSETAEFHNFYMRPGVFSYKVTDEGIALLGDKYFFEMAKMKGRGEQEGDYFDIEELAPLYDRANDTYEKRKNDYLKTLRSGKELEFELMRRVGGIPQEGDWQDNFPVKECIINGVETMIPITEEGDPFTFIGTIPVLEYMHVCYCDQLIFYHYKTGIVLNFID